MSTVKADTVQPKDFATDLTLGASGDTVTVAADSININKVQDKGGNTLWDYSTGEFVSTQKEFASQNLKLLSTAVASGSSSVSFTTGIDSTYDVYVFKFINMNPATDAVNFTFQVSTNGGSTYNTTLTSTAFRTYHRENDAAASLDYVSGEDQAQGTSYQILAYGIGNDSDQCAVGELHLFSPASTVYVKPWYATTNRYFYSGSGDGTGESFFAGYFNTTTALNAIDFKMGSGTFDGTIKMYGLL